MIRDQADFALLQFLHTTRDCGADCPMCARAKTAGTFRAPYRDLAMPADWGQPAEGTRF